MSHAELDEAEELDRGDPAELAALPRPARHPPAADGARRLLRHRRGAHRRDQLRVCAALDGAGSDSGRFVVRRSGGCARRARARRPRPRAPTAAAVGHQGVVRRRRRDEGALRGAGGVADRCRARRCWASRSGSTPSTRRRPRTTRCWPSSSRARRNGARRSVASRSRARSSVGPMCGGGRRHGPTPTSTSRDSRSKSGVRLTDYIAALEPLRRK